MGRKVRASHGSTAQDLCPETKRFTSNPSPSSTFSALLQMVEPELVKAQTAAGQAGLEASPNLMMTRVPSPPPLGEDRHGSHTQWSQPLGRAAYAHNDDTKKQGSSPQPTPPGGEQHFTEQTRKSLRGPPNYPQDVVIALELSLPLSLPPHSSHGHTREGSGWEGQVRPEPPPLSWLGQLGSALPLNNYSGDAGERKRSPGSKYSK
jgi:hypothetical protein